jgi:hypothetical protein
MLSHAASLNLIEQSRKNARAAENLSSSKPGARWRRRTLLPILAEPGHLNVQSRRPFRQIGEMGFKQFRLTVIDQILRPTSRKLFDFSS